ncbi:MAG: indole-3-glycerol phosphate synthase TrpC [Veillonellales bacterium]
MSFLQKIVDKQQQEVAAAKRERPLACFISDIRPGNGLFRKSLYRSEWSLIAECKLASPVKGQLCSSQSITDLARIYTANGAAALSVHTNSHFRGQLIDIAAVRQVTDLPILRKDFIVDSYEIYESRYAGADAVLLIAAILSESQLTEYLQLAGKLGLDCLVEVHSREELQMVLQTPAELIGINNRDLKTFKTDIRHTFELLPECGSDRCIISESGVRTGEEARRLKAAGVRAVLAGEGLVTAADIDAKVRELALLA